MTIDNHSAAAFADAYIARNSVERPSSGSGRVPQLCDLGGYLTGALMHQWSQATTRRARDLVMFRADTLVALRRAQRDAQSLTMEGATMDSGRRPVLTWQGEMHQEVWMEVGDMHQEALSCDPQRLMVILRFAQRYLRNHCPDDVIGC